VEFNVINPAKKTHNIRYAIRDIILLADELKRTGKQMYYLNIGDPNVYDFETPPHIIDAVVGAMRSNLNGYAPSTGIDMALDAIRMDAERKGISNVLDIWVTSGAAEAIETALTALLNPGENFLMPTPGYPLYTAIQSKLDLEPNPYYLDEENGWQPDIEDIKAKINNKTRAIVLINPNNPTGSLYSRDILEQIVEIALQHNLVVLADEIYDKLIFDDGEMISIAALNPNLPCITFSGLSKNFIAPGWRIGWGVVSGQQEQLAPYIEAINKILRARVSSNHPEQYAIPTALLGDHSHLNDTISRLVSRRDLVYSKISKIEGIDLVKPMGAFYAFPSIDVKDDSDFCVNLLKETGVVVVPGVGFGQKPNTNHFRIVILPTEDILDTAFDLIGEYYKHYKEMNG